jgi:phosphomannomutase
MTAIKFGTDGWRAIIAKDYTIDNVTRVAEATAVWMGDRKMKKVVIGYDCRFGGQMFAERCARVFGTHNIEVILSTDFVSTPMISLAVVKTKADMGVVITASHNPPSYNGYKLKSAYGGPTTPSETKEVENLMPSKALNRLLSLKAIEEKGLLSYLDLEQMYFDHVVDHFDMKLIREAGAKLAFDAMYGAGQRILPRILPTAKLLHCDFNPSFKGQAPEPIARNLKELAQLIKDDPNINVGLANDGDADRIGMFDEDGTFVDSHHLLLLLLYYMHEYKGMRGKVIYTFSVTDKMKQLANMFGLESQVTKIGFKYIAEIMIREDVIVGGEESGGLAVKGHIPERDGIWMGLLILEFMAKTGKSIKELIQMVYEKVGAFNCDRDDLHITQEIKAQVIQNCKDNKYQQFGEYSVRKIETVDGFKFILTDDIWLMVRPSGTEPVLRIYCQAPDAATVRKVLDIANKVLLDL